MRKFILLVFLLIWFIYSQVFTAKHESLTWDEPGHYNEGVQSLYFDNFSISPNSPTFISQIAVIPKVLGSQKMFYPRLMITLLSATLGMSLYFFSKNLLGLKKALLSVFFYFLTPSVLAHSHYITLDIGFSLFFFLAFWSFLMLLQNPCIRYAIFSGFTTGLMFASKITGIGFFILTVILLKLTAGEYFIQKVNSKKIILFIIFVTLGIWSTYRFQLGNLGGFTKGASRLSNKIYSGLSEVKPLYARTFEQVMSMPVPFGDYPRLLKNAVVFNSSVKKSFFLGKLRESHGLFFIILILIKNPIPYLIFFAFGLKNRKTQPDLKLVLVPIAAISIFILLSKMDLRLRYLLPIVPFVAIIISHGVIEAKLKLSRIWLIVLSLWFTSSLISVLPYSLSYSNELTKILSSKVMALSDSNIDWGQGLIALNSYAKANNIGRVNLSYYGSDNPNNYGFKGYLYGNSCKKNCTVESTNFNLDYQQTVTAISITNWQECGFYQIDNYSEDKIKKIVGGSILIF